MKKIIFVFQTDTADTIPTFSFPPDVQITSLLYHGLFTERKQSCMYPAKFPSHLGWEAPSADCLYQLQQ